MHADDLVTCNDEISVLFTVAFSFRVLSVVAENGPMLTQHSHMLQVAAGSRSRLQGGCVQTFCTSQAEVCEVRQGVFVHSFLLAGNLLRSCSDNRLNAVLVMFRNSCFSASKIKLIRGWLIDRARPMNFSNSISRYSLCQE